MNGVQEEGKKSVNSQCLEVLGGGGADGALRLSPPPEYEEDPRLLEEPEYERDDALFDELEDECEDAWLDKFPCEELLEAEAEEPELELACELELWELLPLALLTAGTGTKARLVNSRDPATNVLVL